MRKLALALALAVLCISAVAQSASAGQVYYDRAHMIPVFGWFPARNVDFATLPYQAATGKTVPFFTNHIKSPLDHNTYTFSIVGTDPTKNKVTTTLKYVPILLRVKFPDGTVLDPTKPGCNDTVSVEKRFLNSPLFDPDSVITSNGVNMGKSQIEDAFMRAEFYTLTKGTSYHVLLMQAHAPRVIDVNAPSGSTTQAGACAGSGHNLGMIDINGWDSLIVAQINKYVTTTEIPVVAAYNVVETEGGCCIIGYHNAYGRSGGTQVYSTGAYTDAGIFSGGIADIHAWTHELGELINDPFIDNATPAWGHVGQVSGCQNNLEVGDPLTGTPFLVKQDGFTYHPQELAFFSWFFRTKPLGTGGVFSFEGTFKTAQGACT